MKKLICFLVALLIGLNLAAQNDSLAKIATINRFRDFLYHQSGVTLKQEFYTDYNKENKPYLYVYVSRKDRVKLPDSLESSFLFCGSDPKDAEKKVEKYKAYDTFIYKTYANSSAKLNRRFMSYQQVTQCFILGHEFIHNLVRQENLGIPYEFEEAMGDVVGAYGGLEFFREDYNQSEQCLKMIQTNEEIYEGINRCADTIDAGCSAPSVFHAKCTREIRDALLQGGDLFQRDRLDAEVNNAYLLKNRYYSQHYFELKRVFEKSGSLAAFLKILSSGPKDKKEFYKYFKSLQ